MLSEIIHAIENYRNLFRTGSFAEPGFEDRLRVGEDAMIKAFRDFALNVFSAEFTDKLAEIGIHRCLSNALHTAIRMDIKSMIWELTIVANDMAEIPPVEEPAGFREWLNDK